MSTLEVIHGDIWKAFDADPSTALMHGVTLDRGAVAGFASTVVKRLGDAAMTAHFGVEPGKVCWLTPRIGAGVTQRVYGAADPSLTTEAIVTAAKEAHGATTALLVPSIGGGLGGLDPAVAREAIEEGACLARHPVKLYLWP